jgi:hypothetical protein
VGVLLAAVVVVAAAAAIAAWVPPSPAITDLIAAHDVGQGAGQLHAFHLQTARDAARGRLLQLGAGLFAAAALVYTARNFTLSRRTVELTQHTLESTRRTVELTEQGQVTDRYTKAIEQLGSDKLDIRIGAIYALERITRDSPRDHPTVMEVLAAFVREHSREQWPRPEPDAGLPEHKTRPDVQAAITVIGRRDSTHDRGRINLAGANLAGADLTDANLSSPERMTAAFAELEALGEVLPAERENVDLPRTMIKHRGRTPHRRPNGPHQRGLHRREPHRREPCAHAPRRREPHRRGPCAHAPRRRGPHRRQSHGCGP